MATKIAIRDVTKIFGKTPRGRPLKMLQSGASKDEILEKTGHVVGLRQITFDVDEGELFVVMGLSGSGKSTAIRTVNKLVEPTDGSVQVDGIEVTELRGKALQDFRKDKMGMVFQHFALFPHHTVRDNTGYGLKVKGVPPEERAERAEEALGLVGLSGWGDAYPRELSGGMQQRVGLARALATDPDILLMDEAFSALDPLIKHQMQDELMTLQGRLRKTILFITHDLNEALRVGNRVCIMKDGAVVQIGTPEQIITNPATAYVAEFVQSVDQGRVLLVDSVMSEATTVRAGQSLGDALALLNGDDALYCVDEDDRPVGILTAEDARRAQAMGTTDLDPALRRDFPQTDETASLAGIYEMCGAGLPLAVTSDGRLIGVVRPLDVLAELGKVETIADRQYREGTA